MPKQDQKNVSSLTWVIITALGFVLFVAAAVVLMIFSDKAANLSPQVYFFLLVFVGLIAAGFLFGALKAHAKYSGKFYGGTLSLGGPAVILFLIIYFGLKLAPTAGSFDAKFMVFGDTTKNELVSGGLLKVLLNKPDSARIENGVVTFTDISSGLLGKTVTVIPSVPGYYKISQQVTFPADGHSPIELHLKKQADSVTVRGKVIDIKGQPVPNALIVLANGLYKTNTDQLGFFSFNLPVKDGTELPVNIYRDNKLRYNNTQIFSPKVPLTLQLTRL
ncbi:carboxypeptidase regulatory-like domain-containing protein [Mucilaginibacter corticis]|uniref:Carboxypeptidase regulatory-like domain-containing protein n=1 Tax=Mucilaginibacter corticis TaxID=2597670 RepID=A0A556MTX3_9SPHI|nr:carboxypeptidase-like regulatory domain-containing protein [Mucilaginibacter corticis]TSJ43401.1 carboxypeptidase regulatory-like domain-containing protein [Mucilaginibacter corticis]